jgi:hypothetical protein
LWRNPGENFMQFLVTALLAEAFSKGATLSNAGNIFKMLESGLWTELCPQKMILCIAKVLIPNKLFERF